MIVGIVLINTGLTPLQEFRTAVDEATGVADFCNSYTPPLDPLDYLGINSDLIDLQLLWAWDFASTALVEIVYEIGVPVPANLDTFKNSIVEEIVSKRDWRFDNFFILAEYPATTGKMFSCSIEAQDNWDKLETLFTLSLVTYPFEVWTYDERDTYNIIDMADLTNILAVVATQVLAERTTAQTYIDAVLGAVDEATATAEAQPYLDL